MDSSNTLYVNLGFDASDAYKELSRIESSTVKSAKTIANTFGTVSDSIDPLVDSLESMEWHLNGVQYKSDKAMNQVSRNFIKTKKLADQAIEASKKIYGPLTFFAQDIREAHKFSRTVITPKVVRRQNDSNTRRIEEFTGEVRQTYGYKEIGAYVKKSLQDLNRYNEVVVGNNAFSQFRRNERNIKTTLNRQIKFLDEFKVLQDNLADLAMQASLAGKDSKGDLTRAFNDFKQKVALVNENLNNESLFPKRLAGRVPQLSNLSNRIKSLFGIVQNVDLNGIDDFAGKLRGINDNFYQVEKSERERIESLRKRTEELAVTATENELERKRQDLLYKEIARQERIHQQQKTFELNEQTRQLKEQTLQDKRYTTEIGKLNKRQQTLQNKLRTAQERQRQLVAGGDSWANVAMLYGGARTVGTVVDANKELQRAQLHIQGLNLAQGTHNTSKQGYTPGLTNQDLANALINQLMKTPNVILTKAQATESVYHAASAFGHFNYKNMSAILPDLVTTAQATKFGGYSNDEMGDIIRNYIGVIEARQQINDIDAMRRTIKTIWKTQALTGGKIGPKDLEVIFRNLGSGASTITDEGLLGLIAIAEQSKPSGGGSSGGAGSGVASVGTIVKMVQLMAAGKPVAISAKKSLYEAGIIDDPEDDAGVEKVQKSIDKFNEVIKSISVEDLKKAGFANKNEIWADPIMGIAKMRTPLLQYMLSTNKNVGRYFGTRSMDDDNKFFLGDKYKGTEYANNEVIKKQIEKAGQDIGLSFLTGLKVEDLVYKGVITKNIAKTWTELDTNEQRLVREEYKKQKRKSEKEGLNTLFATMGFSHRVVAGMSLMTDADFLKRYGYTVESAKNTKEADQVLKLAKDTNNIEYAMLNFDAALTRVYESFQPLVEQCASFINALSEGMKLAANFFGENGLTGTMTVVSLGIAFATKGMLAFFGAINNAIRGSIELKTEIRAIGAEMAKTNAQMMALINKRNEHLTKKPIVSLDTDLDTNRINGRRAQIRANEAIEKAEQRTAAGIIVPPGLIETQRAAESVARSGEKAATTWSKFSNVTVGIRNGFNTLVDTIEKILGKISGFVVSALAKVGSLATGIGVAFAAQDVANIIWDWAKSIDGIDKAVKSFQETLGYTPKNKAQKILTTPINKFGAEQLTALQQEAKYYELQSQGKIAVWKAYNGETIQKTVDPNGNFGRTDQYVISEYDPRFDILQGEEDSRRGKVEEFYGKKKVASDKYVGENIYNNPDYSAIKVAEARKIFADLSNKIALLTESIQVFNDKKLMNYGEYLVKVASGDTKVDENTYSREKQSISEMNDWILRMYRAVDEEDYYKYDENKRATAEQILKQKEQARYETALSVAENNGLFANNRALLSRFKSLKFEDGGLFPAINEKINERAFIESGGKNLISTLNKADDMEWYLRTFMEIVSSVVGANGDEYKIQSILQQDPQIGLGPYGEVKSSGNQGSKKIPYTDDVFKFIQRQQDKYIGGYNAALNGQQDPAVVRRRAEDEVVQRMMETPLDKQGQYSRYLKDATQKLSLENLNKAGEDFNHLVDQMVKVLNSRQATQSIESLQNTFARLNEEYENLETQIEADSTLKLTALKNAEKAVASFTKNAKTDDPEISLDQRLSSARVIRQGAFIDADKLILSTNEKLKQKRLDSLSAEMRAEEEYRQAVDEIGKNFSYLATTLEKSTRDEIAAVEEKYNRIIEEKRKAYDANKTAGDVEFEETKEFQDLFKERSAARENLAKEQNIKLEKLLDIQAKSLKLTEEELKQKNNEKAESAIKSLEEALLRQSEEFSEMKSAYNEDIISKMAAIISVNKTAAQNTKGFDSAESDKKATAEANAAILRLGGVKTESLKYASQLKALIEDQRQASLDGEEKIKFELKRSNDELIKRVKYLTDALDAGLLSAYQRITEEFNIKFSKAKSPEDKQKLIQERDVKLAEAYDNYEFTRKILDENSQGAKQANDQKAAADIKRLQKDILDPMVSTSARAEEEYLASQDRVNYNSADKLSTIKNMKKQTEGALSQDKFKNKPELKLKQEYEASRAVLLATLTEANNFFIGNRDAIRDANKIGLTERERIEQELQEQNEDIRTSAQRITDELIKNYQDFVIKAEERLEKAKTEEEKQKIKAEIDKRLANTQSEIRQTIKSRDDAISANNKQAKENLKWSAEQTLESWTHFEEMANSFTSSQPESFASAIEDALDGTENSWRDYWQKILKDLRGMFLRESIGYLWKGLGLGGTTAQNGAALSGGTLVQGITSWITGKPATQNQNQQGAQAAAQAGQNAAQQGGFFSSLGNMISGAGSWIGDMASKGYSGLKSMLGVDTSAEGGGFLSSIFGGLESGVSTIGDWASSALSGIKSFFGFGGDSKSANPASAVTGATQKAVGAVTGSGCGCCCCGGVGGVAGGVGGMVGGLFGGGNGAAGAAGEAAKTTLNMSELIGEDTFIEDLTDDMTGVMEGAGSTMTDAVSGGLGGLDFGSIFGNIGSFFKDTFSSLMGGLGNIGSTVGSWASSAMSWVGSFFADGGVMTPYGKATLQKYARGGIATSPQVALFGEGSMNEAYVPLPDGRSIPVTLNGSGTGGNAISISIVVKNEIANGGVESSNESVTQNNSDQGWNQFANNIKSMVVSEIANQSRPGGLLYNGHA